MNQKLKELLIKEHPGLAIRLEGIGDEPDEAMYQAALKNKHKPVDMSKCQEDEHAPSKIASHFPSPFLPVRMRGITSYERAE